ncbi:MAG: hypothetical protein RIQ52_1581 [Pseudomonadota bacterium]|jgi:Fe-S cluster biosynthesis and repair protein YggX
MTRTILCVKLGTESEAMDAPPFPGTEGQRIFEHVSREAWSNWLKVQTMLINEHRLTPFEPKARAFLQSEREKYLFGGSNQLPDGYTPPKT